MKSINFSYKTNKSTIVSFSTTEETHCVGNLKKDESHKPPIFKIKYYYEDELYNSLWCFMCVEESLGWFRAAIILTKLY